MHAITSKKKVIVDATFILLLCGLPIILNVFFNFDFFKTKVSFVIMLSIWTIIKIHVSGLHLKKITIIDVSIISLSIYALCHFYFFSEATIYYYKLWGYISYVFVFYMFKWIINTNYNSKFLLHFILLTILILCASESIMGLLQYFEVLKSKKIHFNLLGTFSSPNFFAVFLSFGFIILIWYYFILKINKKRLKTLLILCFLLFGSLIILSKSRATWIAILGSVFVLFITSNYGKNILKKITIKKALLAVFIIIISSFFLGKQLYHLKPESVKGRALATKISLQELAKHPIKGHGLFSFAGTYNAAKAHYFSETQRPWDDIQHATYLFTPYNDYLLMAFELGILFLLGFVLLILFVITKTKLTTETRLGLALFLIIAIWGLFNAPSEKVRIMLPCLFGFALMVSKTQLKSLFKINDKINRPMSFILKAMGVLIIYVGCIKLINSHKYLHFGNIKNTSDIKELTYLSKFVDVSIYTDLYFARKLNHYGNRHEAITYLEKTLKKSAAPRVGKQLASYYSKEGNYKRAENLYKFNISVEPYRYEPRIDLLTLLTKSHKYDKLVTLSQEIIDFPVKVASEKIDTYKKSASKKVKYYSRFLNSNSVEARVSPGKLIKSSILNKTLPYKVYLPPINKIDKKLPVIYINDGYSYIRNGKLPILLDSLIINNIIEPVAAVFLDPRDKNEKWKNVRQELFLCNPKFVDFFTKEFMPTVEKQYPIRNKREDRTILGLSFGGLAAAYLGNQASNHFKNIVMQSPAFHPCPDIYKLYDSAPNKDFKMYLSYGTGKDTEKQDLPFIKILQRNSYNLKINRIKDGNHKWPVWKAQLDDILLYYFKK